MGRGLVFSALLLLLAVSQALAVDELHDHEALLSLGDTYDDAMLEDYHYNTPEDDHEFEGSVEADNLRAARDALAEFEFAPTLLDIDEQVAPKSKVPAGKPKSSGDSSKGGKGGMKSDLPAVDLPFPSYRTGKCKNKLPDAEVVKDILSTRYKRVCVKWSADKKSKKNICKVNLVVRLPRVSKRYARLLKTGKVRQKVCGIATMRGSDCTFKNRKASCVTIGRLVKAYQVRLREAVDRVVHCYLQTHDRNRCSDPVVPAEQETSGAGKSKTGKKKNTGSKGSKGKVEIAKKKKASWWMWPDDTKHIKAKGVWMPGPLLDTEHYDELPSKIKSKGERMAKKGGVHVTKNGKKTTVDCGLAEVRFRKAEKQLMKRKKLCSEGNAAERGACEEKLRKQVKLTRVAQRRCHKKYFH